MKKTKRFLAMLLTLILGVSEIGSTGLRVFAAGEDADTAGETAADETESAGEALTEKPETADAAEPETEMQSAETQDIDVEETEDAADEYSNIADKMMFGTAGMADPFVPVTDQEAWQGSYIYLGNSGDRLYRVLDKETTDYNKPGDTAPTMLVEHDSGLALGMYGDYDYWANSDIKESLNTTFLRRLPDEWDSIAPSYKVSPSSTDGKSNGISIFAQLKGEDVFLLDEREAKNRSYGYADHNSYAGSRVKERNGTQMLRSTANGDRSLLAAVDSGGRIVAVDKETEMFCSPALNIDLSKVLFSKAVNGKKGELNTAYMLTLKTDRFQVKPTESGPYAKLEDGFVHIPYFRDWNADSIAVMILDGEYDQRGGNYNTANILYYGKLEEYQGLFMGWGKFKLPEGLNPDKWGKSYRVYVVAERSKYSVKYADVSFEIPAGCFKVIRKHTVHFDLNGGTGSSPKDQNVVEGECASSPEIYNMTLKGYLFGGWYTTKYCLSNQKYDFKTPVTEDITLYAKWRKICKVSFDANGGTGSIDSFTATQDDYIILPECSFIPPKDEAGRDEMVFEAWLVKGVKHKAGTKLWIEDDTEIIAGWMHLNYKDVNFYDKYGDDIHLRIKYLDTVEKPEDPYHEGYTFLGWYTYNYADNKADDRYLYDFSRRVSGNLNLYAAYTDDTVYHIGVESRPGGKITTDKEYVTMYETVTLTVTPDPYFELWFVGGVPIERYSGYHFVQLDSKDLTDGKYVFTFPNMAGAPEWDKDIRITAYFRVREDHEHTWEYHEGSPATCHEDGTYGYAECTVCHHRFAWDQGSNEVMEYLDVTDDESPYFPMMGYHGCMKSTEDIEAKEPTCSVSGNIAYTYCNDCGACLIGPNYGYEGTIEDVIIPIDENAHDWDASTVTYTWEKDQSAVTASCICKNNTEHVHTEKVKVNLSYIKEPTCEEGGTARLTTDPFEFELFTVQSMNVTVDKLGHDWSDVDYIWSEDLSQVSAAMACKNDAAHKVEETVNTTVTDKGSYKVYTAEFTNEAFDDQSRSIIEVSYDANGAAAAGMPESEIADIGETVNRPVSDPAAEGLKFVGWYETADGNTVFDFDKPLMKNTIVYARWADENAKLCTVSFNMMGHGAAVASVIVESGKTVERPDDPIDAGWIFVGWYTEETLENKYDFSKAVTEGFTLYAKWTERKASPSGGRSALDPVPDIFEDTKDIYLVKGQKFVIGGTWSVADDGESKKYVSINKKGQLTAKKAGSAVIKNDERKIIVHIFKPEISKNLKLEVGQTVDNVIELKEYEASVMPVLWYSASPDVATVKDGVVTAVSKGKAKITAYINGSAYNCTVSVKESKPAESRTLHLNVGSSKSVSVKGVKEWISADTAVATARKKKITAVAAGNTTLTASANGITYTIDLYAEDISISGEEGKFSAAKGKNKYNLDLTGGDLTDLVFSESLNQKLIFKSSKPQVVFIDENGHIEARSSGKAKLTAKINGKTITINVNVK